LPAVFVHLSDIHFGQEKKGGARAANDDARRKLIEDAAGVVAKLSSRKAAGIIVTGDIAYAGKVHEYEEAGKWLDQLAENIGCEPSTVQVIPGNHDIDRDKITGAAEWMLNTIHEEGEEKLESFLGNDTDRDVLYSRFEAYLPFAKAYRCPLDCQGHNSADRRVELADGRAIRFVRLNSALICTKGRDEQGQLLLGQRQRILEESAGEELIVLVHHPLNWISDSDDMRKFLHGRARVCMSGHEHLAAVDVEEVEPGCDILMIASGATTPDLIDDVYTYAYNIIEFDWDEPTDSLAVTIHPRRWNDGMKRFEPDEGRLNGRDPRFVLGSPYFRQAQLPEKNAGILPSPAQSPEVEIVVSQEEAALSGDIEIDEGEYQTLYLRFFRDLAEGDRVRILVELGAIPVGLSAHFNHETESRLLRSIVKNGRFDDLKTTVSNALRGQMEKTGNEA
jgi:hypothetical protein